MERRKIRTISCCSEVYEDQSPPLYGLQGRPLQYDPCGLCCQGAGVNLLVHPQLTHALGESM